MFDVFVAGNPALASGGVRLNGQELWLFGEAKQRHLSELSLTFSRR